MFHNNTNLVLDSKAEESVWNRLTRNFRHRKSALWNSLGLLSGLGLGIWLGLRLGPSLFNRLVPTVEIDWLIIVCIWKTILHNVTQAWVRPREIFLELELKTTFFSMGFPLGDTLHTEMKLRSIKRELDHLSIDIFQVVDFYQETPTISP